MARGYPKTTNFKIGIPFVYAFEVCVRTVRDPEPNTPAAGENNPFADPDDYELGGATLAAPANQVTRRRVVRTVD